MDWNKVLPGTAHSNFLHRGSRPVMRQRKTHTIYVLYACYLWVKYFEFIKLIGCHIHYKQKSILSHQ